MRRPLIALAAATALAAGAAYGPSASAAAPFDPLAYGFQGEGGLLADDADLRDGVVRPTAAQRAAVDALSARAVWNAFGTPKVLTRDDAGYLSEPRAGEPADAARAFVRDNLALFGLSEQLVTPEALTVTKDVPLLESPELRAKIRGAAYPDRKAPHVITLQQVFAGAPAGLDGTVTLALDPDNRVTFASSSLTRDVTVTNRERVSLTDAYRAAAKDAGVDLSGLDLDVTDLTTPAGAAVLRLEGIADQQTVRLVTVPTPRDGVRLAFEVVVLRSTPGAEHDEHPYAYMTLVDAETGVVLHRRNRLQHAADAAGSPGAASVPYWRVFPNAPDFPVDGVQTPDNRVFWCFTGGPECQRVLGGDTNPATPRAYDVMITDDGTETPSFSTRGNNAQTAPSRASFLTPDVAVSPVSPTRTYDFPFTDAWHLNNCDPTTLLDPSRELNDIDAATANLFVMHNRMHDWGYYLGWTEENSNLQVENVGSEADSEARENDPEIGNSQSGSIGGGPTFQGRDNANQITLNDGTPGITNQYLWEPLQAGFYAPCTDGAYDMGIVGHEVGHAISNRMTDGSNGLSGAQAGSMGESWSDLMAVEYLNGFGLAPYADENRYSLAPYVTGDKQAGIRNYGMNASPLNFSNIEYDGNGTTSPHADGEIWSATQFDIRQAMIAKYDAQFPASNTALQVACADGLKPTTACPGNRRWIQLIFDGYLLQPGSTSMLDSRDAILAADKARYGGANLPTLWAGFAKRGMGADAFTASTADREPEADYRNPVSTSNAALRFQAVSTDGSPLPEEVNVYIGHYEARITPLVIMSGGEASPVKRFQPGTYEVYVQAPGFGHRRITLTAAPGETRTVELPLRRNLASLEAGAEAIGDGGNLEALIDDTESTNWGSIEGGKRNPLEESTIQGKQVTVALAGGKATVREVQVSAANRPAVCTGDAAAACELDPDAPYDTGGQSRFAALRSFEILTCDATAGSECAAEEDFTSRLVAKDAFPAGRPRPTAPDLALRTFAIPETPATHVRIKVIDNQCTGGPEYTGEANPTANPLSDTDCEFGFVSAAAAGAPKTTVSLSQGKNVRIAELQVFGSRTLAAPPAAPALPAAAPAPAAPQTEAPPQAGPRLPATGPLPLALPALLLTGIGAALVRGRRRAALAGQ